MTQPSASAAAFVHAIFDIAAWICAFFLVAWQKKHLPVPPAIITRSSYLATVLLSCAAGAYAFGTWNVWISGYHEIARSIEGGIAGGILGVEIYKRLNGVTSRTGSIYALPILFGVAVGRLGCFFAGLEDFTYGTPTSLPWGVDFGDGLMRHPVQLYEAGVLASLGLAGLMLAQRKPDVFVRHAFDATVALYGLQRFAWEFLKPYGTLIGPFTLFHFLSLSLIAYAALMTFRTGFRA
jgi:prolipoprotein diacylglyceryltransferase